jgi:RHS repeat-associated protein
MQETHYYPFGMALGGQSFDATEVNKNKIKFQGQEEQDAFNLGWYHFKWRMHSPEIGRFMSVDPLTEKGPQFSPYCYTFNNPVNLTDPDGRWPDPPFGFRLGFNLGLGSKGINFNVTASVGVEYKTPNFQAVAFASTSYYGGQQLGTSSMANGPQFDLTAGAYATIGNGTASPHNFYTLNYNTASPFNNTFDLSFTYGQMLTYNSAINEMWNGPGIQSEGLVGMRLGENFSLSSNNDAGTYGSYLFFNKHNRTDAGWTGGIVLNAGGVEFGYQNFSGYWPEFGTDGKTFGYVYSAENRMDTGQNGDYHQSLNRAFNFVRKDGFTGGFYSEAWFQRAIHKYFSNDGTYIYNSQGHVNGTVGQ